MYDSKSGGFVCVSFWFVGSFFSPCPTCVLWGLCCKSLKLGQRLHGRKSYLWLWAQDGRTGWSGNLLSCLFLSFFSLSGCNWGWLEIFLFFIQPEATSLLRLRVIAGHNLCKKDIFGARWGDSLWFCLWFDSLSWSYLTLSRFQWSLCSSGSGDVQWWYRHWFSIDKDKEAGECTYHVCHVHYHFEWLGYCFLRHRRWIRNGMRNLYLG